MQADQFSVEVDDIRLGVASETPATRRRVEAHFATQLGPNLLSPALLVARPAESAPTGRALWVLYESGSVVLRRHIDEHVVADAAAFALKTMESAIQGPHLATRLRPVLRPDGQVALVEPRTIHDLAGLDRRLLRKQITVFPTTISEIDPTTAELVVPDHGTSVEIEPGRYPIGEILFGSSNPSGDAGSVLVSMLQPAIRSRSDDAQTFLTRFAALTERVRGRVRFHPPFEIGARIDSLDSSAT